MYFRLGKLSNKFRDKSVKAMRKVIAKKALENSTNYKMYNYRNFQVPQNRIHMKDLFIFLFVILVCACCAQPNRNQTYTSFKETDTLMTATHPIPPIMLYPRGMFLEGDYLVVYNDKMDTCFQVFDRKNLQYLYSFGLLGGGPEDFQMPMPQVVGKNAAGTFIQDGNVLKLISFADGTPVISTHKLPLEQRVYNGLRMLADSSYVCEAGFEENKEYLFIHADGTSEYKVDYPETEERFGSLLARNQAYGRIEAVHPSGERFASFYSFDRRFRIIDRSGEILHDVTLDIAPREKQIPVEDRDRRIHTLSAYATENHIYTLNLDMKPEEIYAQKGLPSIQVFSWEGEPLAQWFLDRFISSFTVDEDSHTIYGVFAENEKEIYTFDWKQE